MSGEKLALIPLASGHVIHKCIVGQADLVRGTAAVGRFLVAAPNDECVKRKVCANIRRTLCDEALFEFLKSITKRDLVPLQQWSDADWKVINTGLCDLCYDQAHTAHRKSIEALWDRLPTIFGLPSWPELHAMKQAAM
ncbi:hypothetical protein B0H17DRAFT_1052339 [Mycena rosella]|uniref:Uncharacterized protein n=1 Tax=Mycena rosella TaxID=1033263 RepID=A0AAD7DQA7_MYCRO|nr:hypothetical protein B0H17DRAFT_1052339 [Mycena rosella]